MTRLVLLLCAVMLFAGCDDSMSTQRRAGTYKPSNLWADGTSARPLPEGTVAQGDLALLKAETTPPPATPALLARGRERYDIFCTPCHGLGGDGDGMIVARGFPHPPSFHSEALLKASTARLMDVITRGTGVMYGYGDRVAPEDRWAITAYIRALQLSRRAKVAEVHP
jgi:mono/diheme cytochrome c family protein